MKLSEVRKMYYSAIAEISTWPEPTTSGERHKQVMRQFDLLPRIKYSELPASIQKAVRNRFPVEEMRSFLSSLSNSKRVSDFDFSELVAGISPKDIDKLLIRARNTAIYTIELEYSDINEEEFAPVLYADYAISAFIDALNQYKTPNAPIQRRKSTGRTVDSWARLPAAKMPTGTLTYFFARLLNAGEEGPKESKINRHEKIGIAYSPSQNAKQYTRITKSQEDTITVLDPHHTLQGGGKAIGKLFFFMLQCWANNRYGREFSFPLQMLVDLGMYKSVDAARLAVKNFMTRQGMIQLSRTITTKKNGKKSIGGIVFYNYKFENAIATISVNENMPMNLLANFFTMFPLFAYGLSTNAFDLVYYIMYLARQNGANIAKNNGKFTISIEAVRQFLELPAPSEVMNYKYYEKIRDPIESAIEEIEENMPDDDFHFTITPRYSDGSTITAWLNGDLEIEIPETQTERFIEIAKRAEQHYKEHERVQAQADATAQAIITAKANQKK